MRAAICKKYGPPEVVEIVDVEQPSPGPSDLLIRVYAAPVNSGDWRIRSLSVPTGYGVLMRLLFGMFRPRKPILGAECAGVVESVGEKVTQFQVGDPVVVEAGFGMGCHADYKVVPESGAVVAKPENLSFNQASSLSFGGTTALYFLRDQGKIQSGQSVLINGASGTVGSAAVQLAKYFGAEVTGVCSSANQELVASIGADRVIDYTQEDFTKQGKTYDLIFDTVGNAPWRRCKGSLTPTGRLLLAVCGIPETLQIPFLSRKGGKQIFAGTPSTSVANLQLLADLASQGDFTPVVDRSYPFEAIVEAHAYVETGRKRGSVVLQMQDD